MERSDSKKLVMSFRGRTLSSCIALALAGAATLGAQPAITAVENAASNIDPRMPNGGIAQGAIFIVAGKGLGPATLAIATGMPFQSTTLSNSSVAVTVGGTTVNALMYYTSAGQLAALLPSNTPTGTGTITVTYNNQTSAKAAITVVANNLAIFSVDSTGTGPAIVTYPDYSLVSPSKASNCGGPNTTCGAANPGDTLILWATGLGPVSGTDATGAGLGVNMPNIPLKVWLGGVQANVSYQGRSGCCVGEDQIVFTVPSNVPMGCAVPLVVQINSETSNSTSIPVATGSRTCSNLSIPGIDVTQFPTLASLSIANLELDHFLNNNNTGFIDQTQGFFANISNLPAASLPFMAAYLDQPPIGTCTVFGSQTPGDMFFTNLTTNGTVAVLDAGSTFTVSGPNGSAKVQLTPGNPASLSATGAFLTPGNYTITGTGGKDVGPFTANITIPVTPTLTSPASAKGLTITRSKGMTVTWNANGSTGHAEIIIASYIDPNTVAQALCTAPASAGTFTIPPYVLQAVPAGNNQSFAFQPGDQGPAFSGTFPATGVLAGIAQSFVDGVFFTGVTIN